MGGGCSTARGTMTDSMIMNPQTNVNKDTEIEKKGNDESEIILIQGTGSIIGGEVHRTKKAKENYIICKFNISQKDLNQEIRLINGGKDEENLKKNCKLFINKKEMKEFNIKHKFSSVNENELKIVCNDDFENANSLFASCTHITEFDFSNFNLKNIQNLENFFFQCCSLKKLDLSQFDCNNIKSICAMFGNCNMLNEIILPKNTENVIDMSFLFLNCSCLETIDFSNFSTNNVKNMKGMFAKCSKIKKLDLSFFSTEKVQNMSQMFYKCVSLSEINLTSFKTNNVTEMSGMFSNCTSLENLNLTTFNTNNVTDMSEMFSECFLLKEINLYKLKNPKIKKMNLMFKNCSFLNQIDISNFKSYNDTDITDMFKGINKNCVLLNYNDKIINKYKEAVN